jgi:hypothetical protein
VGNFGDPQQRQKRPQEDHDDAYDCAPMPVRFLQIRIALVFGLVGLLLGLAYAVAVPALMSAKSLVLLPASPVSSSGAPQRDMQTEVEIALSPTVLMPAAKKAGVDVPYNSLLNHVAITSITDDIISIVAKSSSPSQAERLANDVAMNFVSHTSRPSSTVNGLGPSLLQSATAATRPSILRIPKLGIIGLLIGMLVGTVVAFEVGRKRRRLYKRDDIGPATSGT